jgi:hypothetical protein
MSMTVDFAAILRQQQVAGTGGDPPAPAGPVFSVAGLRDLEDISEVDYVVPGLIRHDTMTILFSPPSNLKSFLALDMALRLAHGMDWLGEEMAPCGVLYVAAEGSIGMRRRIWGWRRYHGVDKTPSPNFNMISVPINLLDEEEVTKLIRTIKQAMQTGGLPIRQVYIDTLARSMSGGDENSFTDMSKLVAALDRIKNECGTGVMGIHHAGKDVSRGARGHSSLKAAADTELSAERKGNELKLNVIKQKDDVDNYTVAFAIQVVDLDKPDRKGKPRTTLVLLPVSPVDAQANAAAEIETTAKAIATVLKDGEVKIASDDLIRRLQGTHAHLNINLNGPGRERLAAVVLDGGQRAVQSIFGVKILGRMGTKWSCRLQEPPSDPAQGPAKNGFRYPEGM